ncbi:amidohydrolase family protein [Nocardia sp. NPDC052566]|uniref:amidohydrolase family protein n=1 Tax=Nocardia sp. NPDC052566 TaxID=3364330 RepID=UPI0037C6E9E8
MTSTHIDIHAHLWTGEYLDLLASYGRTGTEVHRGLGAGATAAELEARFALNDSAGVGHQILSVSPAVPHFANESHAVHAAQYVNDLYADLVAQYPERFSAFAALPLPHLDSALKELTRALDELHMVGATVTTDVLGKALTEPEFAPLFEELNRRGSVLYVHPSGMDAHSSLVADHNMRWMVGAPLEDTIAVMQLILAGVPSRYPDLKIVNSHFGGALPMLLQRADNQYGWESPDTPERPSVAARRMWYDTVGHGHVPALRAAAESFGVDRLILGTDFPYESGDIFRRAIAYIQDTLSPADADAVLRANAAVMLGRTAPAR